jgi:hypothetical protein
MAPKMVGVTVKYCYAEFGNTCRVNKQTYRYDVEVYVQGEVLREEVFTVISMSWSCRRVGV